MLGVIQGFSMAEIDKEFLHVTMEGERSLAQLGPGKMLAEKSSRGEGKTEPGARRGMTVGAKGKIRHDAKIPEQMRLIPKDERARRQPRGFYKKIERMREQIKEGTGFVMADCHASRKVCEIRGGDGWPPLFSQRLSQLHWNTLADGMNAIVLTTIKEQVTGVK
jgi:hypothetical protein